MKDHDSKMQALMDIISLLKEDMHGEVMGSMDKGKGPEGLEVTDIHVLSPEEAKEAMKESIVPKTDHPEGTTPKEAKEELLSELDEFIERIRYGLE